MAIFEFSVFFVILSHICTAPAEKRPAPQRIGMGTSAGWGALSVCLRCKGQCGDFHVERERMQLPAPTAPWVELPDVLGLAALNVYQLAAKLIR